VKGEAVGLIAARAAYAEQLVLEGAVRQGMAYDDIDEGSFAEAVGEAIACLRTSEDFPRDNAACLLRRVGER
jgi:hypothetical protein